MVLIAITLLTALALSAIAAYFSVVGLIAIFAAAPIPIAVMGGALEAAKLVTASWVYRNWHIAPRTIKYYLTGSVIVLSLITSMGIFGYLSKAHMDQNLVSGDVLAKISIYDEKIRIAKENIDANRKAIKQLDDAVDQVMARSQDEKGADKAVAIRRAQSKERARLISDIEAEQKKINQLNEEAAPIRSEVRKVEAEVGPLKYIAALIYGDNPDNNLLEKTVRWVIITLVFVFDPLAILLLIAANFSINERSNPAPREKDVSIFTPSENENLDVTNEVGKEGWSKELNDIPPEEVRINRSKIHEIPKEILDRVFKK